MATVASLRKGIAVLLFLRISGNDREELQSP